MDLDHQLMNGGIAGGDPGQGACEAERFVEIGRTLSSGFRVDEIRDGRRGPWRLNQRLGLDKESLREPGEGIRLRCSVEKHAMKQVRLHRADAHSLAVDGVEATDDVADRKQSAGKSFEPLEVPPHALRKP